MRHERPNDRPVHPECTSTLDNNQVCTCDSLWRGWDGTLSGLDTAIARCLTVEGRRKPAGARGHSADADELDDQVAGYNEPGYVRQHDTEGFWKVSELLKSCASNH